MADRRSTYKQHVIADAQSNISHVQQSMEISLPIPIYFDLELREDIAEDSWQTLLTNPASLQTIKPNKSYHVFVSASRNGSSDQYIKQRSLFIESDIELLLRCEGKTESVSKLSIEGQPVLVARESILSSEPKFQISADKDLPLDNVKLVLEYRKQQSKWRPKFAASLEVGLEGSYTPVNKKLTEKCRVKLDDVPPENFAMLLVEKQKSGKLHLHGWNQRGGSLLVDSIGWKPPTLASCIEQKEKPETVLEKVQQFSRHSPKELLKWFRNLLKLYGGNLCIIISGYPDSEIPWEILALDDENYLGTQAVVARWMEVESIYEQRMLDVGNTEYCGSVISYLDGEGLKLETTYHEREVLNMLQGNHLTRLEEWRHHLSYIKSFDGVGLIYAGSHGYEGISIGSQRTRSQRITALNLERAKTYTDPRPIAFINTCDSALLKTGTSGDKQGFIDVLLAKFASAYIGTLGPVGSSSASKIARRILWAAFTDPSGVQIAELLRQLRAEVASKITLDEFEDLSEDEREKRAIDFIYTFMYVYYGNPMARLKLIRANEVRKS